MIIVSNIVSFLLLTYIANSFLIKKYSKEKSFICFFLAIITISVFNYNGGSPIKAIFVLVIYFLYIVLLFKGDIIKKLLVIIPFFLIQIITELLVGFILGHIPIIELTRNVLSFGYIFGIAISIIISILFTFVYVYILNNIKFHYFPKYAWLIFILPIITIVLLIDVDDYFKLFNSHINIFVNIIGLALSNLILFIIFLLVINSSNIKLELKIEKQKKEFVKSKAKLLSQHYDYNFQFLHDLLHTCNELDMLLNNSKTKEAMNLLNQLTETTYKEFNAIYSNSFILNYVINNNLNQIIENKIDIKTVIEYNLFDIFDFDTQLSLFEYLINLSITSCIQVTNSDRIIIIKSVKTANKIILKILYSCLSINESNIKKNINEILLNKYSSLSIKELNNSYASILISFDISGSF